jgi:class 3 adenylate cyclase/tetratricopeptide (TPR) repeat protein
MRCPKCETETTDGARFCSNCGAPFQVTCPVCGATAPAEATFCAQCGVRLAAPPTPATQTPSAIAPSSTPPLPKQPAGYERRLVTILFADIVSFSTLSEHIDPEELLEIMREAYPCLLEPVQHYNGTVVQVLGDGLIAYFGAPQAQEDDPERAIRAGLEIVARVREYGGQLRQERGLSSFNVRVGVNTGLVVVGEMSPERHLEYMALGDAVNLAARLQQIAPPGGVLVSHATYRHVRGLFDVQPQAPITVKGRQQIEQTYLVERFKPAHLRRRRRGVEGIKTPMVGREPEMAALQNFYQDAIQGGETRLALITGEAGLGKTRLLDEFVAWAGVQAGSVASLHGRANANTQSAPFGVFRDLFAQRFEILESDGSAQALEKFRQGAQDHLETEQADLVGQLAGFDFSLSPAVRRLQGNPSFAEMASLYLVNYFRRLAEKSLLVLLEDLHWADDSSLDLVAELVANLGRESDARLMIACTARPQLFERRPKWGEGVTGFTRLELRPLSRLRSRALVTEILSKAENIPEALIECVVDEAEGSPFFIEELIKMLIEEGVIVIEAEGWRVIPERLAGVHVPPTLAGILQARLDSLPAAERLVLQRAAVVGRLFWDGLISSLTVEPGEAHQVNERLAALRQRELVFHRERSSIAGNQEYMFKHALLRDAAYETVLLKQRRTYHSQVAAWIEANAGERLEEHLALVAGHYADGGQPELAADWFTRAGERAASQGLPQEGRNLFGQALKQIRSDDLPRRWRALLGRDEALGTLGEVADRQADDAALLNLAQQLGDDSRLAVAYFHIGSQAHSEGNTPAAQQAFEQALQAARRAGDLSMQALILPMQVFNLTSEGDLQAAAGLVEQALEIAIQTGEADILARALTNLAPYYQATGDVARGVQLLQQQVEINQRQGNRLGEVFGLINLGYQYLSLGQFETGRSQLERALQAARSMGARRCVAYCLLNLGLAEWRLEQPQAACQTLQLSLAELQALGDQMGLASRQFYLGLALETSGELPEAGAQFEAAQAAFEQLGATPQVVEAQAGLARLALQRGDLSQAEDITRQIMVYLEQTGPQGLELPMLVYLTCARVFQAVGDAQRLDRTLESGRKELQARLDRISEVDWRKTFLEAIPEHRELMDFDMIL